LDAPAIAVLNKQTEIASPLRGKSWVAVNGPSNTSGHRRTFIVIDGTPHIAQRYAIDWVQIGEDNKTYRGDAKDNQSYYCFGADALAVADGVVVEVKDGIPENTPNAASMAVPITLETIAGNHVNLDLGGGVYAMYAHLQPGSLRVKLGERVTRGQVIGLVGNTGNSSAPHLHFQLMDRNSPLGSEGLPYALPEYIVRGKGEADTGKIERFATPQMYHREIPLENEVVEFK
jgi:biotin carboxyl carrier protein